MPPVRTARSWALRVKRCVRPTRPALEVLTQTLMQKKESPKEAALKTAWSQGAGRKAS